MMAQKKSAREMALDLLLQMEREQSYSNLLLNQGLKRYPLDERERRLATELIYGTIQRRYTLDQILNRLVKKGADSLEPWVRQLLRLGLYQLLFLDKIPERAAVHETVQLAKKRGHAGIAGLVNGVLRSYLRRREELNPPKNPQTISEKAAKYSAPEWMIKRMEEAYGEEATQRTLEIVLLPPPVSLRVNRLKISRDAFIERWRREQAGEIRPSLIAPEGVLVEKGGNPAHTSLFEEGYCTIQDESSMLVAHALNPKSGMMVLDMCAAPGGKTTHLAERMDGEGRILACEIHAHKLPLIREQAERLGHDIIDVKQADGRMLSKELPSASFDAILLDAPCSGLGVMRRKPDIKWSKEAETASSLVRLQKALLDTAAKLLKPGGKLVYSTCTWEPRENAEQIQDFLESHPEFSADESLLDDLPDLVAEKALTGPGSVQILPHHFGSDGFFISRLKKKE